MCITTLLMKYCLVIVKLLVIACILIVIMTFGKRRSYTDITCDMNGK